MSNAVDLGRWPLMRIDWPAVTTDDVLQEIEDQFRAVLQRKEGFAQLTVCAPHAQIPNAVHRRRLARMQADLKEDLERYCVADAMVIQNSLARGVVTVLNWLAPSSHPQMVFDSEPPAVAWIRKRLVEERIVSAASRG